MHSTKVHVHLRIGPEGSHFPFKIDVSKLGAILLDDTPVAVSLETFEQAVKWSVCCACTCIARLTEVKEFDAVLMIASRSTFVLSIHLG